MKQMVALCLVGMIFFTSACGGTNISTESSTGSDQASKSEETISSDLDALGEVEVDENLFDVTLTIPAEYVEDETQESLDKSAEENGWKSATLNDDGSVTYVMTKKQHKQMMEEFTNNINESLQELCGSESYPNFVSVTAEDEFTKFTIVTKSEELGLDETFSVMTFYMYGGIYHIFNGTSPVDNIHVDFVNEASGEIISSSDSKDMESNN